MRYDAVYAGSVLKDITHTTKKKKNHTRIAYLHYIFGVSRVLWMRARSLWCGNTSLFVVCARITPYCADAQTHSPGWLFPSKSGTRFLMGNRLLMIYARNRQIYYIWMHSLQQEWNRADIEKLKACRLRTKPSPSCMSSSAIWFVKLYPSAPHIRWKYVFSFLNNYHTCAIPNA